MQNGFVFYEGSSAIDGGPVVGIATGLARGSVNRKTGCLVQVYILCADMDPLQAVQIGDDRAICGDCRHRGRVEPHPRTGKPHNTGRSCYVALFRGPRVVYEGYRNGAYPFVPPVRAARLLAGRQVRVGAYGDPAALPPAVWKTLLAGAGEVTSYTHAWRTRGDLQVFSMASVDSEAEREAARGLGWRTFRVRSTGDPVLKGEGQCPASAEMAHATTCSLCMLCDGRRGTHRTDITILAHGTGRRAFERGAATQEMADA